MPLARPLQRRSRQSSIPKGVPLPSVASPSLSSLRPQTATHRGPVEANRPDGEFEAMLDSALPESARGDDRVSPPQATQPSPVAERPRETAAATTAEPHQATCDL